MNIGDVVRTKGTAVVTIAGQATVAELVELLAHHNIGAVVVSADGHSIDGIVTERDVVRHLARQGADVLAQPVSAIMTSQVVTTDPEQKLEDAAHTMTYSRIRHLPVIENGTLSAIISIGDVVKYRIDQLTDERNHLLEYLHN
ncbi:CBS domain protein [Propionicimonas paludicola]|uniref:CBS domain protein n=1 Tax=Propionicimonas paludicola TaxID=185243 RepID=A0A2A9CMX3_9ACTN|nr:CBS domain-containing protein [Propionicimonas paludicola]PFG15678.1 CBS domain protein [Propionicimonas paludicola]